LEQTDDPLVRLNCEPESLSYLDQEQGTVFAIRVNQKKFEKKKKKREKGKREKE
jgi:hypothetical protein